MGLVSSCLQTDCLYGYTQSINSIYGPCVCLRCFTQQLIQTYTLMFQSGGLQAIPPQPLEESAAASSVESPTCDTYRSPPRPLPYDDPRFAVRMRRDKSSSHLNEEAQLLTESGETADSPKSSDKWDQSVCDGKSKGCFTDYDLKAKPKEVSNDSYYFGSAEDEEVCPTCLEEYSPDNPKIVMQCSHDFHLGCIYEWMERSEACPVCGKKMVFNETT
ncbi:RING/U-box superfamily protein [Rhynchospora pubera]|uniref:RING-type E3 ubiquitin transferase n=1 Tax=Rhynchospora pubera TaxID=906938 RepID=A0AAV8HII7_9POAL|nr:RING/U-box superfamily protein [Rhynchospora pubera]